MHVHKMEKKPSVVFVFSVFFIHFYYFKIFVPQIVFPLINSIFAKPEIHAAVYTVLLKQTLDLFSYRSK